MKKIAFVSALMLVLSVQTAEAAVKVTVLNPSKVSTKTGLVTLTQKMGAKSGTAKLTLKVDKYFKEGDCVHTKCIIYVTNDHNSTDKTTTQAIGFKFGGINLF